MNALINTILRWLNGISAAQWQAALRVVLDLADTKLTGEEKREAAIAALLDVVKGSKANFLIELAIQYAKKKGWLS